MFTQTSPITDGKFRALATVRLLVTDAKFRESLLQKHY